MNRLAGGALDPLSSGVLLNASDSAPSKPLTLFGVPCVQCLGLITRPRRVGHFPCHQDGLGGVATRRVSALMCHVMEITHKVGSVTPSDASAESYAWG